MRRLAIMFAVLAANLFAAAIGLALWALDPPFAPLLNASLIIELSDFVLFVSLVAILIVGLKGPGPFLTTATWYPPLIGLLAAAYSVMITLEAIRRVHPSDPRVVAPSVAECFWPLGLGLLGAAIAAFLNSRKAATA